MARAGRKDRGLFQRVLKSGERVWAVRLAVDGRMQQFSPFKSKGDARAFYQKSKAEQHEGRFFPERYAQHGPAVQSFLDRYMLTIAVKKTAAGEEVFCWWWATWYEGRAVEAMTPEDLEEARRALLDGLGHKTKRPRTPARVNRYVSWLHHVFEHPVNLRYYDGRNPVEAVTPYPEVKRQRHTITPELEARLIARLEQETPGILHAVRLAVLLGLRQGEEFARRKAEVDTTHWLMTIPNAKHLTQPKVLAVVPEAREPVRGLLASPGPWLIPHPENPELPFPIKTWYKTKFRRAVKAVGLPAGFNWHSFRHTFATRMLESGASADTVALAGGWKSPRMVSQVYGHIGHAHVAAAVERAAQQFRTATGTAPREETASQESGNRQ